MPQSITSQGDGATVVITHRVRSDKQAEYELWLEEIAPLCRASPGHLDWHIVRPIPGVTETYTVIIRFDTTEHLKNWMASGERERLIEKVQPLFGCADHKNSQKLGSQKLGSGLSLSHSPLPYSAHGATLTT